MHPILRILLAGLIGIGAMALSHVILIGIFEYENPSLGAGIGVAVGFMSNKYLKAAGRNKRKIKEKKKRKS